MIPGRSVAFEGQTEAFVREVRHATKLQSDDRRRRLRHDYFARDVDADLHERDGKRHQVMPIRTVRCIAKTLAERGDAALTFSAEVEAP